METLALCRQDGLMNASNQEHLDTMWDKVPTVIEESFPQY